MSDAVRRLASALAGRYDVERELGAGGMATVYLARDPKHGRKVAIKVLRPEIGAAVGADRFLLEIKTTANLRHPHIVPLYDSGEAALAPAQAGEGPQTLLYYVMPLIEGESLRDRLTRDKQLPIDEALRIAGEVADALSYAHARGVVHRDIKPENIMLEAGHVVVADFGIARAVSAAGGERLTRTGMAVGTPAYMSPEQAAGEGDIDGRSDLYSLACVLYEMLGGQAPFTGPTAAAITRQHMIAVAPPITNLRPAVPAAVADALQRALSKEPADRFNPVAQFGAAIAPGAATGVRSSVPARRKRAPLIAGGVAVAVIAVAALLWNGSLIPRGPSKAAAASSIAVLPFADLSPDHANAYLGDGLAETLINALANVPGLTVAARTSAFSLRDKTGDLREVGRQLGVATVLQGSVQRAGEQLRVTAQVVRAADGVTLWSERFDRPVADIFAVQDEVARAVVDALAMKLAARADTGTGVSGTRSAAAYEAYLLGRFHWNKRTTDGIIQATGAFKRAIGLDSNYALAWTGLADSYTLSTPSEYDVPGINPDSILALAESSARRAIGLAPRLGEAYSSLGEVLEARHRWPEATGAFEQGIQLSPRYPTGHQWYGYNLQALNRWHEGIREMETAHRLDPLSHVITLSLAVLYDGVDRFADASPLYAQGLAQSPEAWYAWTAMVGHELGLGRIDEAAEVVGRLLRHEGAGSAEATRVVSGLKNPATRPAMVDEIIRTDLVKAALPFSRWLRGDQATIALLERMGGSGPAPGWSPLLTFTVMGPRLRANPRVQALYPGLLAIPDRR